MTAMSYIPEAHYKKKIYKRTTLACFRLLTRWLGLVPKFHNLENRPKNGVAVSNHTTPFDVLILNTDTCYSLVSTFLETNSLIIRERNEKSKNVCFWNCLFWVMEESIPKTSNCQKEL